MLMGFLTSSGKRVSLLAIDTWRQRARTARAMAWLCLAWVLVRIAPFRLWRKFLGGSAKETGAGGADRLQQAVRAARRVERAAMRLPFETKCLPRAMALSWILRGQRVPHGLVIAIRPPGQRSGDDTLHAWVETDGRIVLGELPGPWHEIYSAGM